MPALNNLRGRRFGRLVVTCYMGCVGKNTYWYVKCDCGSISLTRTTRLLKGRAESCGCLRGKSNYKHGLTNTVEYRTWANMKSRCSNPKDLHYPDYGGRGIRVCPRWLLFLNFLVDMGIRPKGYSLDRYPNNDGHYEPTNCRWATPKQQANNRGRAK